MYGKRWVMDFVCGVGYGYHACSWGRFWEPLWNNNPHHFIFRIYGCMSCSYCISIIVSNKHKINIHNIYRESVKNVFIAYLWAYYAREAYWFGPSRLSHICETQKMLESCKLYPMSLKSQRELFVCRTCCLYFISSRSRVVAI